MLDQSIDKEFLTYFMQLNKTQKRSLLTLVKSFLSKENRVSVQKYNEELEAALDRIKSGHYTTQNEVEKELE